MSSEILRPTGAGTYTEISGVTTGYEHWQAVSEAAADNDVTKVVSGFAGNEDFPISSIATDTYACANPALRSGTDLFLDVTIVSKASIVSGTRYAAVPIIYFNGGLYALPRSNMSTYYRSLTGRFGLRPDTGAAWTYADIDSVEIGVRHFAQFATASVTLSTTQVYATVQSYSPWNQAVNSQHTFLNDSCGAIVAYLTNPYIQPTGIGDVCKFLAQYDFECTSRKPWGYGKGKFPRVHAHCPSAETFLTETMSYHVRPTVRLSVWTLDTDPEVAAAQNINICGAIGSALMQSPLASSTAAGSVTREALITHYANWGNIDVNISGPYFVQEPSNERGLCLGQVDVRFEHIDT